MIGGLFNPNLSNQVKAPARRSSSGYLLSSRMHV